MRAFKKNDCNYAPSGLPYRMATGSVIFPGLIKKKARLEVRRR